MVSPLLLLGGRTGGESRSMKWRLELSGMGGARWTGVGGGSLRGWEWWSSGLLAWEAVVAWEGWMRRGVLRADERRLEVDDEGNAGGGGGGRADRDVLVLW